MVIDTAAAQVNSSPALQALHGAVTQFRSEWTVTGLPEDAILDELAGLRNCVDILELAFSAGTQPFAATDGFERLGFVSPLQAVRQACGLGTGAASDRMAVGEVMAELPLSTEAVVSGSIGFTHLAPDREGHLRCGPASSAAAAQGAGRWASRTAAGWSSSRRTMRGVASVWSNSGRPRRRLISAPELPRRRDRERDDDRDVLPTWKPPPEDPIPF